MRNQRRFDRLELCLNAASSEGAEGIKNRYACFDFHGIVAWHGNVDFRFIHNHPRLPSLYLQVQGIFHVIFYKNGLLTLF